MVWLPLMAAKNARQKLLRKAKENKGSFSIGSQPSLSNSLEKEGGGKNSLISVSLLKIKVWQLLVVQSKMNKSTKSGIFSKTTSAKNLEERAKNIYDDFYTYKKTHCSVTENTSKALCTTLDLDLKGPTHSLLNGELDADDEIWNDFNDSEKLKNNLEVLLTCKKMNLNFEVARNIPVPGILVIPKFHCQRCFNSWMKDGNVPKDCTLPEDPVRGAPIALDERAHIFLKDQNVSYIEIKGSQSILAKKLRNVRLTSSLFRRNKLLASRESSNEFSKDHTDSKSQSPRLRNHARPSSEAIAKPIDNDEKMSTVASSRSISGNNDDSVSGVTDVFIKYGTEADGIRRYGGLTNSQARVFVNSSLLNAEAGSSEKKQRTLSLSSSQSNNVSRSREQKIQSSNNIGVGVKKKSSKDALNRKSSGSGGGLGKKSKRSRGGKNRGGKNGSKSNLPDSGEDSKISVTSGNDVLNDISSSGAARNKDVGSNSKAMGKLHEKTKAPIAQSLILGMDLDEASGAAVERKQPQLKSKQHDRRGSVQSIQSCSGRNSSSRQQSRGGGGKDYEVKGEGNNLQSRQESRGRRRGSSNPLGLGFTQSSSFQQQNQHQQRGGDDDGNGDGSIEGGVENDRATPSKMQVRIRRDSFPCSFSSQNIRRSSLNKDSSSGSGGGRRQIILKQKTRNENGKLPPVTPPSDLFKGMSERTGSEGSSSCESRPSSRTSHSRCFKDQYDSKGNFMVNSSHAGIDNITKNNKFGTQHNKKRNIFFASKITKYRKNSQEYDEVSPSNNALRTPSPPLTFPKCELAALKMMSMTSRCSFSYYQSVPAQYKKHNESVRNRAMNVGKRKVKSPRKKKK